MSSPRILLRRDDQGQIFVGYLIALSLIMITMLAVLKFVRANRTSSDQRIHQTQALEVAEQGFEDAVSFFRRNPNGVFLDSKGVEFPLSRLWVTPWPIYPDAAFLPGSADTDHWNKLSFSANTNMASNTIVAQRAGARALIRTYPLSDVQPLTTSTDVKVSPYFARYVIRRQNKRNWSPGPNTYTAFDDPEAVHDISHVRYDNPLGSGTNWTIVSHGYILDNPAKITYNAYYENPAMFSGGDLINAPVPYYNGKRFLLAQARVYGELYRINFNAQAAAVWIPVANYITMYSNGIIKGTGGYAIAISYTSTYGGSASFVGGDSGTYLPVTHAPSISSAFPGQTAQKLSRLASAAGDISIFPLFDDPNLSTIATRQTFYYVGSSATFLSGTSANVMTGNGLVVVNGDLTFNQGNLSSWNGIVFVNGNCVVHSPVNITGSLIVTGTLKVGDSPAGNNKAEITYDYDLVKSVEDFLQKFRLDKNSIQATFN